MIPSADREHKVCIIAQLTKSKERHLVTSYPRVAGEDIHAMISRCVAACRAGRRAQDFLNMTWVTVQNRQGCVFDRKVAVGPGSASRSATECLFAARPFSATGRLGILSAVLDLTFVIQTDSFLPPIPRPRNRVSDRGRSGIAPRQRPRRRRAATRGRAPGRSEIHPPRDRLDPLQEIRGRERAVRTMAEVLQRPEA